MSILIPSGKKLIIKTKDNIKGSNTSKNYLSNIQNVDLVLEEDLILTLKSHFGPIVDISSTAGLQLVTEFAGAVFKKQIGTTFKELGFQIWKKTDPLTFSVTVGLYMKSNAQYDVWKPALDLIKLPLPDDAGENKDGVGLIPPGPSILENVGIVGKKFEVKGSKPALHIQVGNVVVQPAFITAVEPVFSKETDQYDFPIWCKLKLDITSLYIATTNMIDDNWGIYEGSGIAKQ